MPRIDGDEEVDVAIIEDQAVSSNIDLVEQRMAAAEQARIEAIILNQPVYSTAEWFHAAAGQPVDTVYGTTAGPEAIGDYEDSRILASYRDRMAAGVVTGRTSVTGEPIRRPAGPTDSFHWESNRWVAPSYNSYSNSKPGVIPYQATTDSHHVMLTAETLHDFRLASGQTVSADVLLKLLEYNAAAMSLAVEKRTDMTPEDRKRFYEKIDKLEAALQRLEARKLRNAVTNDQG